MNSILTQYVSDADAQLLAKASIPDQTAMSDEHLWYCARLYNSLRVYFIREAISRELALRHLERRRAGDETALLLATGVYEIAPDQIGVARQHACTGWLYLREYAQRADKKPSWAVVFGDELCYTTSEAVLTD